MQYVTNPVRLPSLYFMKDIPFLLDPVQYFFIVVRKRFLYTS
jgi:hypothetical protein